MKIMHSKIVTQGMWGGCVVHEYSNGMFWFYWQKDVISILQLHGGACVNLKLEWIFCSGKCWHIHRWSMVKEEFTQSELSRRNYYFLHNFSI